MMIIFNIISAVLLCAWSFESAMKYVEHRKTGETYFFAFYFISFIANLIYVIKFLWH